MRVSELSDFDRGVIVGLLIGEGSFGGDGKQPQVTLRMHTRHEAVFRWLLERFPDSRLYGPYHHGGRSYFQWMARGRTLVRDVLPVLEHELHRGLDVTLPSAWASCVSATPRTSNASVPAKTVGILAAMALRATTARTSAGESRAPRG